MEEDRKCKNCGKLLTRRSKNGLTETVRDFRRREFCNLKCSGKYAKSKPTPQDVVSAAVNEIESGDEDRARTAMEYLVDVINGKVSGADIHLKVNAAKALLPYQEKRADEKPGKKDARQDAAKQAATGKFGARPAPSNVIPLRKEG